MGQLCWDLAVSNTNWNTTSDIDTWYGVTTKDGKVTVLDLGNNELTGSIPAEFGNLTYLTNLHLLSNRLSGPIPTEFGNLTTLGAILLMANQFEGDIPLSFTNLSNLVVFQIGYNMLTASDESLINFLNAKQSTWADTQTIPPSNLGITDITNNSLRITWTPITYTEDGGYYTIKYSTTSGGPYIEAGNTLDKLASEYNVTGLYAGTTYFFVIVTYTPKHDGNGFINQINDLISLASNEISAKTECDISNINVDADDSGTVDIKDAIILLQVLTDINVTYDLSGIDADCNERIDMSEIIYILRSIAL